MQPKRDPAIRDYGLRVFICVVLATAAWAFQATFLPAPVEMVVPSILLAGGIFLGFFEQTLLPRPGGPWIKRGVGLSLVGVAIWTAVPPPPEAELPWQPYSEQALVQAREQKKPVLIYFHADWCGPCHVFERTTLSRKIVVDAARDFVALKADVTDRESPAVQAINEKFAVVGLPAIVFFGADGEERRLLRVFGVEPSDRFIKRLSAVQ